MLHSMFLLPKIICVHVWSELDADSYDLNRLYVSVPPGPPGRLWNWTNAQWYCVTIETHALSIHTPELHLHWQKQSSYV